MKYIILIFLNLVCAQLLAQEATIPVRFWERTAEAPTSIAGTDTFGWLYTITNNTFRKEKDSIAVEYKSLQLGDIFRADLQNPLQIVLFYRKFNTVVLLDNQLNETTRINFSNIPEPIIADAASLASQNRLWVYDQNTQRLGLYDLAKNIFAPLTPPFTDNIKYYTSDYNYFYWIDTAGNAFVSNLFGNVKSLGPVPDFDMAQMILPNMLLFSKDNRLYLFNIQSGGVKQLQIAEKSFTGFSYTPQILTIFTGSETYKYEVILP